MEELEGATVVYVGRGEETLLNLVHSLAKHRFLQWRGGGLEPVDLAVSKLLMRRYYLVEKTRDAGRVGLLVGTLGTEHCTEMLDKLRKVVKVAGKKVYTFLVGKPNVAKLANFPEIDVFCLVACPEQSFLDCRDFLQPVVTPWELELACNKELEWTGEWVTDYSTLLEGGSHYTPVREPPGQEEDQDQEGDMSLVTGRVRGLGVGSQGGAGELMVLNDKVRPSLPCKLQAVTSPPPPKTVSVLHEGGGGQFLASKSWAGLEQHLGKTVSQSNYCLM